ncbi:hypothetical protein FZEAL_10363 [Fusarium zealandicum]|uniref:Uncharacterized protein n=1 Tax=Fusarium zealandicum TaxID=1053134 RepID=A0A8H4U2P7_9HYPO|nr:hypothetical protein FZEAL_10363 [Fusarium zealandicum]
MASLARGFCLPGLRPLLAPRAETALLRSRFFTTSLFRAAEPTVKAARPPPSSRAATPSAALSRYAFVKSLATKSTPTTLYESASHFWFYFGCWTSGLSIITWTALTAPSVVKQPDDVPVWVGLTFGASYLLLVSMGFYLISKTPNIVGSIRVLPTQTSRLVVAGSPVPLQMEVTVKSMVPMFKPKVITTPLDQVSLKTRFSLPEEYVPELRRQEMKRVADAKTKALRKFDMEHLFTMPFRRVGRAFAGMFNGVKSAWTDSGYGVIQVDGKNYKVDVTKGFAHDGFRTLEKIVDIKP